MLEDWESNKTASSYTYEFDVNAGDFLSFDYYGVVNDITVMTYISVTINGEKAQLQPTLTGLGTYSQSFSTKGKVTMIVKPETTFDSRGIFNVMVGEKPKGALRLASNHTYPLFNDCPLDSVYIGRKIIYPTISSLGYSPFYRNKSLRSVRITDKEINIPQNEFYGCIGLKNVWIGNNVATIGNWAFSDCYSLDYFEFGSKMETIGKEAFSDCANVTKIISHAATPPICGSQALDDINKWNCTLKVPLGYETAYRNTDQWKEFLFVEGFDPQTAEGITDGIGTLPARALLIQRSDDHLLIQGLHDRTPVSVYSADGRLLGSATVTAGTARVPAKLRKGDIAIVKAEDVTMKLVVK